MLHKSLLSLVRVPEYAVTRWLPSSYNVYGIGYIIKHTTTLCLKRLTFRSPVDSGRVAGTRCSFPRDRAPAPQQDGPGLPSPARPLLCGRTARPHTAALSAARPPSAAAREPQMVPGRPRLPPRARTQRSCVRLHDATPRNRAAAGVRAKQPRLPSANHEGNRGTWKEVGTLWVSLGGGPASLPIGRILPPQLRPSH